MKSDMESRDSLICLRRTLASWQLPGEVGPRRRPVRGSSRTVSAERVYHPS